MPHHRDRPFVLPQDVPLPELAGPVPGIYRAETEVEVVDSHTADAVVGAELFDSLAVDIVTLAVDAANEIEDIAVGIVVVADAADIEAIFAQTLDVLEARELAQPVLGEMT